MFHVVGCITEQHDLRLVVLAALLCLIACTTAMTMIARGRAAGDTRMRTLWLVIGGVVAGCGIWGLHFVAMLAYRSGLPVAYDVPETILSVVIAAAVSGLGFRLALSQAGGAIGGAVTGAAISAMHYVGMAAVRIPAIGIWDSSYVVASLVIGVVFTSLALHIALKRDDLAGYAIGAALFLVAIVGMHFTAMSAVRFFPDSAVAVSGAVMDPSVLAIAVASVSALVMALGLIGALVDHHLAQRASGEATRLREHVQALEKKELELEMASTNLRLALVAADTANEAKSQFLAAMSHELRTPLNAVIGFAEMLTMQPFGPLGHKRYLEYLNDIRASGVHLLSLINDILDLTKLESGANEIHEEDVGVEDLIAAPLRMVESQARAAGLSIAQFVDPGLPRLVVDRRRMQQVLINLLSNAIKFTPSGGEVTLHIARDEGGIEFRVSDTGIGMRQEDIPKAFELFRQVDSRLSRSYEGAGLGLPLARRLVESHGGKLELESTPNEGTTAIVRLPASRLREDSKAHAVA